MSKKFSDDDLLGGSDDDETNSAAGDDTSLDDDQDGGEILGAAPDATEDEKVEFEITDGDEQQLDADGADDAGADDKTGVDGEDFDTGDTGEEIDDDLLSAEERKNYSKGMAKRISRERRLKQVAEGQLAATGQELASTKRALLQSNIMGIGFLIENLDGKIAAKNGLLKAAKEAANSDEEIKLTGELDDLRANKREAESNKATLEKVQKDPPAETRQANPLTARWLARNKWMNHKDYQPEQAYARQIDATLADEFKKGNFPYGPDSPQYFQEMDRRINKGVPTLRARAQRSFGQQQQRPQQRVGTVQRQAPAKAATGGVKGNKVQITREDMQNMRDFGLNPNDKAHLSEYARTKRDRLRQESQGA